MSKEKIQTYVQLYSGNVELNIAVTDKLKIKEGFFKNFGHITVSSSIVNGKECFWDNLPFFFDISRKKFKERCGKDLKQGNFDVDQTYKDVKRLIKRAFKLKILTTKSNIL